MTWNIHLHLANGKEFKFEFAEHTDEQINKLGNELYSELVKGHGVFTINHVTHINVQNIISFTIVSDDGRAWARIGPTEAPIEVPLAEVLQEFKAEGESPEHTDEPQVHRVENRAINGQIDQEYFENNLVVVIREDNICALKMRELAISNIIRPRLVGALPFDGAHLSSISNSIFDPEDGVEVIYSRFKSVERPDELWRAKAFVEFDGKLRIFFCTHEDLITAVRGAELHCWLFLHRTGKKA